MGISGLFNNFNTFFKNNKAQGAVEYILLVGGIIIAAIIIIPIYREMARTIAKTTNESVNLTVNITHKEVSEEIVKL